MPHRPASVPQADVASTNRDVLPRLAYRVDGVAEMLGVCPKTIHRMIRDGRLRSNKTFGVRLVLADSVRALFYELPAPGK